MADLAKLAGYLLGVLIAGRIAFVIGRRAGSNPDDATYTGVLAGVLWPIVVGVGLALLPIIAIGWIISRPTRTAGSDERATLSRGAETNAGP